MGNIMPSRKLANQLKKLPKAIAKGRGAGSKISVESEKISNKLDIAVDYNLNQ